MTESFKQQLQALIDQAAEKSYPDIMGIGQGSYRAAFKQGCEFLMPVIESLVEMRNQYIDYRANDPSRAEELKQRIDKELLQLLKGEK